jgi:hypothetical protein
MSDYTPDKWVIAHITSKEHPPINKVIGSWYGGYGGSDSWRMNSGIEKIEDKGDFYNIHGYSGSVYQCYKGCEGMSSYTRVIMNNMATQIEESGEGMMRIINIEEILK